MVLYARGTNEQVSVVLRVACDLHRVADEADESEQDEVKPAKFTPKAMTDTDDDRKDKSWKVEDELSDRKPAARGESHVARGFDRYRSNSERGGG